MSREEAIRLLSGLMFKGKLKEALDIAIKALEQEPSGDLISREVVLKQINCWIANGEYRYTNATDYLSERIRDIPSVNPQEPKAEKVIKMHYATSEERESVDKYVKSISKPTGVDFWDLDQEPSGETVSLEAFKQVMWERDTAISQLKELGYGFGQKIEHCDDAISRQWLMECVNEGWIKFDTEKDRNRFIHLIRDIAPPVNPQEPCEVSEYDKDHIWYKGGQYISLRRFLEVKAEAEQEPCGDAISRQIISDYVESHIQEINTGYGDLNKHTNEILRMIVNYIEKMEPVTQEPKTGHWIDIGSKSFEFHRVYKCSECGNTEIEYPEGICRHFRYCPNCGAKMESEG